MLRITSLNFAMLPDIPCEELGSSMEAPMKIPATRVIAIMRGNRMSDFVFLILLTNLYY